MQGESPLYRQVAAKFHYVSRAKYSFSMITPTAARTLSAMDIDNSTGSCRIYWGSPSSAGVTSWCDRYCINSVLGLYFLCSLRHMRCLYECKMKLANIAAYGHRTNTLLRPCSSPSAKCFAKERPDCTAAQASRCAQLPASSLGREY